MRLVVHLLCGLLLSVLSVRAEPPVEPTPAPAQVEFSQLVVKHRPPRPVYPLLAKIANIQGTVELRLTINPRGGVERAEALNGPLPLRGTAEALCRLWVFEPVLVDGQPARVQCDIRVPFRLNDVEPRPGDRPFKAVVELVLPPAVAALGVDEALAWDEVRDWLGKIGVACVETAGEAPDNVLHLRLEIQIQRMGDDLFLCFLKERCSLWGDRDLQANEPGKPQRIGYISHVVGQKGEAGFQELARITLRRGLHEFLDVFPPLFVPDKAGEAAKQAIVNLEVSDVDFAQVKVKHQPAAPAYPPAAKMRGIQGTVVVVVTIDPTGRPVLADAISGPYELLQTAIRYALAWEFEPARINGVPKYARFKLTMPFRLRERVYTTPFGKW